MALQAHPVLVLIVSVPGSERLTELARSVAKRTIRRSESAPQAHEALDNALVGNFQKNLTVRRPSSGGDGDFSVSLAERGASCGESRQAIPGQPGR